MSELAPVADSNTLLIWALGRYNEANFSGDRELYWEMREAGIDMWPIAMHDLPGMDRRVVGGATVYYANFTPGHYLRKLNAAVIEGRKRYGRVLLGGFSWGGMEVAYREAAVEPLDLCPVDGVILAAPNEYFHTGDPYSGPRDLAWYAKQYKEHGTLDPNHGDPWLEYRSRESADDTTGEITYLTPRSVMYRHIWPYWGIFPGARITVASTGILDAEWAGKIRAPTEVVAASRDTINRNTDGLYRAIPSDVRRDLTIVDAEHDYRDKSHERRAMHAALIQLALQFRTN